MEKRHRERLGDASRLRHVAVVGASGDVTAALVHALSASIETRAVRDDPETTGISLQGARQLVISPLVFDAIESTGAPSSYLVNLIGARDSAGCVRELDAALALSDGVLVVVDCDDGVSLLAETALQTAVRDDKKILLLVNKAGRTLVDRSGARSADLALESAVAAVNAVIRNASTSEQDFEARRVSPSRGNVAFGAIGGRWAFNLTQFGALYAPRFDLDELEMTKRLWGDWSFDAESSQWSHCDNTRPSAFDAFVCEPLRQALKATRRGDLAQAQRAFSTVGFKSVVSGRMTNAAAGLDRWLPLRACVLGMMVHHVPSPVASQQQGISTNTFEWSDDVAHCRVRGALVAHVVKILPSRDQGRRLALARVLSGKMAVDQEVNVVTHTLTDPITHERRYPLDPSSSQSSAARIKAVGVLVGDRVTELTDDVVPAGNLCVVSGVSEALYKTGIITTCEPSEIASSALFRRLIAARSRSTPMTVRVTLTPADEALRGELLAAMLAFAAIHLDIECYSEESGELTLAATTPRTLQIGLASLREALSIDFSASAPYLCYRETVTARSPRVFMSKSPNKNVKLRCKAEPLDLALAQDLSVTRGLSLERQRARIAFQFGWSELDVENVLNDLETNCSGANLLVNEAPPHVRFDLLKEPMLTGFAFSTGRGVLCEEPMYGVLVTLCEMWLFGGLEHRWGRGQTTVAMRRLVAGMQLASSPALLEPVLLVEIQCHADAAGACMDVLLARGARVDSQDPSKTVTRFHLPVRSSFGLDAAIHSAVKGAHVAQICSGFSHYEPVEGDPLDADSVSGRIVRDLRLRKHLDPELLPLRYFIDDL